METLLILKTGALGDVLRTTSILPGLAQQRPGLRVTWLTAHAAKELVAGHPLVSEVVTVDPNDEDEMRVVRESLTKTRWDRVLSFDDEQALCELASALECGQLSGAHLAVDGSRTYSADVEPWFGMGLLSKLGKEQADELKLANQDSHASLFAKMLGIEQGEPSLPLSAEAEQFGAVFAKQHSLRGKTVIGLNTGAGGRWVSKQLSVEKTIEFAAAVAEQFAKPCQFVVLGGPSERARNLEILAGLRERKLDVVDSGSENSISQFAAITSQLDLLLTSDSLALHVGVARRIPIVAFFAPTSAAEIELFGRGVKVVSTSEDYCTYRSDVDTSSITVARLVDAAHAALAGA